MKMKLSNGDCRLSNESSKFKIRSSKKGRKAAWGQGIATVFELRTSNFELPRQRAVILPVVLFVLIMIGLLSAAFAFQIHADFATTQAGAGRLQTRLAEPYFVSGHEIHSTASIGIVDCLKGYMTPDQVLRDADSAMYAAKAAGKASYFLFNPSMRTEQKQFVAKENLRYATAQTVEQLP